MIGSHFGLQMGEGLQYIVVMAIHNMGLYAHHTCYRTGNNWGVELASHKIKCCVSVIITKK